jgi:membrane-associated protease RseP (regulator of RpoE activity)
MKKNEQNYLLHFGLFLVTLITTMFAGTEWTTGRMPPYEFSEMVARGLPYSLAVLFIISVHEFGHYFAARYHKVNSTLPFYIPFPPVPGFLNFGTMGAVIKTRDPMNDNIKIFDIGVAGPVAGFVATVAVLIYGFTHLPGVEYILSIHPDYFSPDYGKNGIGLIFGNSLLYSLLQHLFTTPGEFVPPMSEMYHYPFLMAGWFGLLITSMNLMPVGQLDGGHVIYGMFGSRVQEKVASVFMAFLITSGFLGVVESYFDVADAYGWAGWLFWAGVLYFAIKVKHPPVYLRFELDLKRKILGWFAIIIFILSFIPVPFTIVIP